MTRNLTGSPFSEFSLISVKSARRKKGKQFLDGHSRAVQDISVLIENVARTKANVLILGESGTGKELVARAIHTSSDRADKPFVTVNCAAIPTDFLESELFGHEKGAFPAAVSTRVGKFELAKGGTVFLDEIGDMDMQMQAKLLHVLQDWCFQRVGGSETISCDVRIIAATHLNLQEMVAKGQFRDDLYYRLNVFPIDLPPLRRRTEDIPALIFSITEKLKEKNDVSFSITSDALKALSSYHWPGNVRELSNVMERLSILYPDEKIDSSKLPQNVFSIAETLVDSWKNNNTTKVGNFSDLDNNPGRDRDQDMQNDGEYFAAESDAQGFKMPKLPENGLNLKAQLSQIEVHYICEALERCDGVVAKAAKLLGLQRTTLVEKLRKYAIQR